MKSAFTRLCEDFENCVCFGFLRIATELSEDSFVATFRTLRARRIHGLLTSSVAVSAGDGGQSGLWVDRLETFASIDSTVAGEVRRRLAGQ